MLTAPRCERSLLCSIELWLRFIWYSIHTLCVGKSPLTIGDGDILARQLFSGHVRPSGKVEVSAFIASASNGFGISLDRWSKAPERLFKALAIAAATARRSQTFKGFALFDAASLKSIHITGEPSIRASAVPTKKNPFHADIQLALHRDKSFYLFVATELRNKTKPQAIFYK